MRSSTTHGFSRQLSGAIALLLATGSLSLVASPADAAQAGPADSGTAGDAVSASAIASKYGHSVVIEGATTPTSETSALPDGTMRYVSNTLPVRVRRGTTWVAVDESLNAQDGVLVPKASASPVRFSAGGNGPLASVQLADGTWVSETWPLGALPAPTVDNANATYPDVLPGVDLRLTATPAGMSQVLVVRTQAAATNAALANLSLSISGAQVSMDANRSLRAQTAKGATAMSSSPVWWDSSTRGSDASGPAGDGGLRPVNHSSAESSVSLDVAAIAATPNVKYPIFVDPDWSVGAQAYWFTDQAYPTQSYLNGQYADGYQSVGAGSPNYLSRAFWEFGTSPLNGKQILGATFNATELWSNTCSARNISAFRYGNANPGFTWSTDPNLWGTLQDTKALPPAGVCAGSTAVGFAVTDALAWAASTSSGRVQIGLRAQSETDQLTRRHFALAASITVNYNTIPATPSGQKYTSPPRVCSTDKNNPTPLDLTQPITLAANVSDSDGQNLTTTFSLLGVTNTSFSKTQTAGGTGTVTTTIAANTLVTGNDYRWHAQSSDGIAAGGASGDCYLRATNASPAVPIITKTSTGTAVVGSAMTVKFTGAASDGDVLFAYWWTPGAPPAPTQSPALTPVQVNQPLPSCSSTSGPVTYVCPAAGSLSTVDIPVAPVDTSSTLWVVSYNSAGRPSQTAPATFSVGGLSVSASPDNTNVSVINGHIWDSSSLATTATSVPDLNTTSGSVGTNTRQLLGAPLSLVSGAFRGIPTTFLGASSTSQAATSERTAIDTKTSFTASAYVYLSGTAAQGVPHVAMSENTSSAAAFTLGTDANGNPQFCRTVLVTQATACATSSTGISPNKWVLITGVWDSIGQNLRIMTDKQIIPTGVTPQAEPTNDTSAAGWLCVGGSCSYPPTGTMTTSKQWEGMIYRPSVFPGVVSGAQLNNLWKAMAPTDAPPADTSIGQVVNLRCDQVATPQQMYDYSPMLSGLTGWTPSAGTLAAKALTWNGVTCRWMRESGGVNMDISVAKIVDRGTMTQLQSDAALGTPVSGLGDAAYYNNGTLQMFNGQYWVIMTYPWTESGDEFAPLSQEVLSNLP